MMSDLALDLGGIFLSFCLQVTAAYLTCSLVNRTLAKPRQRFRILTVFLSASAVYWVGLIFWNLRFFGVYPALSGSSASSASTGSSFFVMPIAWSPAVLIAGKILAVAYLAMLVVLLAVSAWRQLRLRKVLRQGWAAPESIQCLFEQIRADLGISRCELLMLPGITSPATAGWLRPRVLLPAMCEDLGATSRLADVLHHELAHVARRDYFWAALSDLACRLIFFHPAVWRARKLARFQGELACDLAVVEAQPERRADYADSLAYFVRLRMMEEQAALGIDFANSGSTLGTRIRLILAGSPVRPWWKRIPQGVAALTLTIGFAVVAPALTISLSFFRPLPARVSPAQAPISAASTRHHRGSLPDIRSTLPPVTDLNTLRVTNSFPQNSSYSFARAGSEGAGASDGDLNRPWKESEPSMNHPSIASVIRDSVAIAVSRSDHDRDRENRTTH